MKGNNMGELISVIIPCFNVEKYIDRCLESVLNQTYQNLEILLVDDGSTDGTGESCDRYSQKDERINVVHKKNGGLSSARNAGLDICRGHYIVFIDSDDWISADAIQYLYDLRKRYEADFSIASYMRVYGNKEKIYCDYEEYELTQREFLTKFFKIDTQENVQYAWAKLYKKELFSDIRYPVNYVFEDVPTTFEIAIKSKRIAYSTKIIYFYYFNPNSITEESFNDRKFDLIKIWEMICKSAYQNGEQWILSCALINRKRADFGILMDLAISNITLKEKFKYLPRLKENRAALKKNMFELCKAKIPLSRKIFIICFSRNYQVCLYALHFISKLKYRMTKKRNREV